jgi:hypothetical protein
MQAGLQNLLQSRKAWFVLLVLVLAGALVAFHRISWDQFVDLAKWLGTTFLIATGVEGKGSPTTGTP